MAANPELVAHLLDALTPAGGVSFRRMLSGGGLFRDGLMFALIVADDLYLKVDAETEGAFVAEGLGTFEYDTSKGRKSIGSLRRAPERLLDEPDELLAWARRAMDAARRADRGKRRRDSDAADARRTPQRHKRVRKQTEGEKT